MKTITIDGVEYNLVPKEKSELNLLKEKYESGSYICIGNRVGSIDKISELDWPKWHADWKYKLIHKKHRNILDAWLNDNNVEIEYHIERDLWAIDKNFIDKYKEDCEYRLKQQYSSLIESKDEPSIHLLRHLYHDLGTLKWIGADEGWDLAIEKVREYLSTELNNRLKPEQRYPIFKRNEEGEVFRFEDSSSYPLAVISNYRIDKYTSDNHNDWSTTPYDKERGLYHLQPVWRYNNQNEVTIDFYSKEVSALLRTEAYKKVEPITSEQLKAMPFLWEMYQQVLKDKQ